MTLNVFLGADELKVNVFGLNVTGILSGGNGIHLDLEEKLVASAIIVALFIPTGFKMIVSGPDNFRAGVPPDPEIDVIASM